MHCIAMHCNWEQRGEQMYFICVCVCDRCADLYVDRGKLIVVNVMWYGLRPLHCWNVLCALTIRLFTPYTLLVFRFLSISIVDYIVRNVLLISFNNKKAIHSICHIWRLKTHGPHCVSAEIMHTFGDGVACERIWQIWSTFFPLPVLIHMNRTHFQEFSPFS